MIQQLNTHRQRTQQADNKLNNDQSQTKDTTTKNQTNTENYQKAYASHIYSFTISSGMSASSL